MRELDKSISVKVVRECGEGERRGVYERERERERKWKREVYGMEQERKSFKCVREKLTLSLSLTFQPNCLSIKSLSLYHWKINVVGPIFKTLFPTFLDKYHQLSKDGNQLSPSPSPFPSPSPSSSPSSSPSPPSPFLPSLSLEVTVQLVLESVVDLGMEKEFLKSAPSEDVEALSRDLDLMKVIE